MSAESPLLSRLRLQQLQLACRLAEVGSLRSAADSMHLSAAALSKSLRELESVLGQKLFVRSSQGLVPTTAGEHLVRRARAIIAQVGALGRGPMKQADEAPEVLRLGAAPALVWSLMPEVLALLSRRNTSARIRLWEGRIVPLAEQLLTGNLDAILTFVSPEAVELLSDPTMAIDQLYSEPMVVVRAEKGAGPKGKASWSKLRKEQWILPPPTFTQRTLLQRAFLQAGVLPPEPVIESISIPAMVGFAEAGLGLTAAPWSTVRRQVKMRSLRVVRTETEIASIPVAFAYRKLTPYSKQLFEVREAFAAVAAHSSGSSR